MSHHEKIVAQLIAIADKGSLRQINCLRIDLNDDVVRITGWTTAYYYKQLAQEAIKKEACQKGLRVENSIEVLRSSCHARV